MTRPADRLHDPAERAAHWVASRGDPDLFTPTPAEVCAWEGYLEHVVADDGEHFTAVDPHGLFGCCWIVLSTWKGHEQRWQYVGLPDALEALATWRRLGTDEPRGWTKHYPSERRNDGRDVAATRNVAIIGHPDAGKSEVVRRVEQATHADDPRPLDLSEFHGGPL